MGAGEEINTDGDYFSCIVKAFEILGNPVKRRSYDSIDPKFDNMVPAKTASEGNQFFRVSLNF
jgi:DnaJ family protein C protein 2